MLDWRFWRWRKTDDDETEREIRVHLDLAAEERVQAGAPVTLPFAATAKSVLNASGYRAGDLVVTTRLAMAP